MTPLMISQHGMPEWGGRIGAPSSRKGWIISMTIKGELVEPPLLLQYLINQEGREKGSQAIEEEHRW